jgi:hypothetical protein
MNELKTLGSMGLELPSVAWIIGSLIFGIVGWIAWRRGRKAPDAPLMWGGLALMLYPYAVSQTWLLWVVGTALSAWVWWRWRQA